jgi:hypothetical protein
MLAKGKLKPTYYAFYDDDILYDRRHANSSAENQNDIKKRILDETPRLHTQYEFVGIESNFQKRPTKFGQNEEVIDGEGHTSTTLADALGEYAEQNNYGLYGPLGTRAISSLDDNQKQPRYTLDFLEGELVDAAEYRTASNHPTIKVPQLNVELTTKSMSIHPQETSELDIKGFLGDPKLWHPDIDIIEYELVLQAFPAEDGSIYGLTPGYLILDLSESQVDPDNRFDIEIYEIEERSGEEILKQLQFIKTPDAVQDGLLLSKKEYSDRYKDLVDDLESNRDRPDVVEHYFHVIVDQDIDPEHLSFLTGQTSASEYYGTDGLGDLAPEDVYTNIEGTAESDLEDC